SLSMGRVPWERNKTSSSSDSAAARCGVALAGGTPPASCGSALIAPPRSPSRSGDAPDGGSNHKPLTALGGSARLRPGADHDPPAALGGSAKSRYGAGHSGGPRGRGRFLGGELGDAAQHLGLDEPQVTEPKDPAPPDPGQEADQ